jgi:hypothetical protein
MVTVLSALGQAGFRDFDEMSGSAGWPDSDASLTPRRHR